MLTVLSVKVSKFSKVSINWYFYGTLSFIHTSQLLLVIDKNVRTEKVIAVQTAVLLSIITFQCLLTMHSLIFCNQLSEFIQMFTEREKLLSLDIKKR